MLLRVSATMAPPQKRAGPVIATPPCKVAKPSPDAAPTPVSTGSVIDMLKLLTPEQKQTMCVSYTVAVLVCRYTAGIPVLFTPVGHVSL